MKILSFLAAIACACFVAGNHTIIAGLAALLDKSDITGYLVFGACISFTDLKTATESLSKKITNLAFVSSLWNNAIPRDVYPKNTGVEQTTFTMNNSEPDDLDNWEAVTLDGNGQPESDGQNCPNNYDTVDVSYFSRTYGPERLRWRGPVICKDQLTYQHNVVQFLNGYEKRLVRNSQRKLEFYSRQRFLKYAGVWSDGVFTPGPVFNTSTGVLTGVTPPTSDITQGQLDLLADGLIQYGATEPDSDGYIMLGGAGMLFTLEINSMASQRVLKNNTERRQDARWAMANELWRKIGATTVIGNFRHAPTHMAPRFTAPGGVLTQVRTFKNATEMTSNGDRFTAAYRAAPYEMAIAVVKSAYTIEVVSPEVYKFQQARNYMGELEWIEGGERILQGCYDPQHKFGTHFGEFELAARPDDPNTAMVVIYKRPAKDVAASDIYAYPGSE